MTVTQLDRLVLALHNCYVHIMKLRPDYNYLLIAFSLQSHNALLLSDDFFRPKFRQIIITWTDNKFHTQTTRIK